MVFAPLSRDHLHRLTLEGEPGFALSGVRGQHILEATEGFALPQGLPERTRQPRVAALIGEVLHDAKGLRRLDGLDAQPAIVIAGVHVGFVRGIGAGDEQDVSGLDVQPVTA